MKPDPFDMVAPLRSRVAQRARETEVRRIAARSVASLLARRLLDRWGAKRVVLHGSLACGAFHEHSDIDLAVEGLPAGTLIDAAVDLDELAAPFTVDILPLDRIPPSWRECIERHGVTLS